MPSGAATTISARCCIFFNDTATTEIYTLSLHDALPIYPRSVRECFAMPVRIDDLIPRQSLGQRSAQCPREVVLLESNLHDRVQVRAHVADADIHRDVLILAVPHAAIGPIVAFHFVRAVHIDVALERSEE